MNIQMFIQILNRVTDKTKDVIALTQMHTLKMSKFWSTKQIPLQFNTSQNGLAISVLNIAKQILFRNMCFLVMNGEIKKNKYSNSASVKT